MRNGFALFVSLLTRTRIGLLGVMTTAGGFVALGLLLLWEHEAGHDNPYIAIVAYNVAPGAIGAGLAMIPAGWLLRTRKVGGGKLSMAAFYRAIGGPDYHTIKWALLLVGGFGGVVGGILGVVGYHGYHFMESPRFCGEVCHVVMEPEYTAHKRSDHAGVACVKCHIGPGASWFVKSKLSGAWQVVAVSTSTYPRPIETPVKALRPAPETCHECHDPALFKGNRMVVRRSFADDEQNTPLYTILNMRIGGGEELGHPSQGIHWHLEEAMTLTYQAADPEWDEVVSITVTDPDGSTRTWRHQGHEQQNDQVAVERVMDCVDCHNRTAHHMMPPEDALDERLAVGAIDANIPWIKREALAVLAADYGSEEEARAAFDGLSVRYREQLPEAWASHGPQIEEAAEVLEETWGAFVYPHMNIGWQTYESRLTHSGERGGCFRCHNHDMVDDQGRSVSRDCEICHFVLAEDDPSPDVFGCLHVDRSVDLF